MSKTIAVVAKNLTEAAKRFHELRIPLVGIATLHAYGDVGITSDCLQRDRPGTERADGGLRHHDALMPCLMHMHCRRCLNLKSTRPGCVDGIVWSSNQNSSHLSPVNFVTTKVRVNHGFSPRYATHNMHDHKREMLVIHMHSTHGISSGGLE